jgi:hypothetical protein
MYFNALTSKKWDFYCIKIKKPGPTPVYQRSAWTVHHWCTNSCQYFVIQPEEMHEILLYIVHEMVHLMSLNI